MFEPILPHGTGAGRSLLRHRLGQTAPPALTRPLADVTRPKPCFVRLRVLRTFVVKVAQSVCVDRHGTKKKGDSLFSHRPFQLQF